MSKDDIPVVVVDVPLERPCPSWGFSPTSWTLGAGVVVLVQFFVIAALVGALLGKVVP